MSHNYQINIEGENFDAYFGKIKSDYYMKIILVHRSLFKDQIHHYYVLFQSL